eukprot:3718848-Pleurochrysis_carterae.AAC.1
MMTKSQLECMRGVLDIASRTAQRSTKSFQGARGRSGLRLVPPLSRHASPKAAYAANWCVIDREQAQQISGTASSNASPVAPNQRSSAQRSLQQKPSAP